MPERPTRRGRAVPMIMIAMGGWPSPARSVRRHPRSAGGKDPALAAKLGTVLSDSRVKKARTAAAVYDTGLEVRGLRLSPDPGDHSGLEHQDRHRGRRDARARPRRTASRPRRSGGQSWSTGRRPGPAVSQGVRRSDHAGVGLRLACAADQGRRHHPVHRLSWSSTGRSSTRSSTTRTGRRATPPTTTRRRSPR